MGSKPPLPPLPLQISCSVPPGIRLRSILPSPSLFHLPPQLHSKSSPPHRNRRLSIHSDQRLGTPNNNPPSSPPLPLPSKLHLRLPPYLSVSCSRFYPPFPNPPSYLPFANSIYATYSEASIPLHSILPLPPPPVFPLAPPPPLDTCTSLSTLSKRNTPSPVLRASFLAHSATAHTTIPVYTDGSRSPQSVGASAIYPDHSYSVALSSFTSSYSAELAA